MDKNEINIISKERLMQKLANKETTANNEVFQGVVFFGNVQETVPVKLLRDPYLTCKAKIAWQQIKLYAKNYQGSAFPSYDELQLLLSDNYKVGVKASRKVVAQTLIILQLTGWLSLTERARAANGQVLGNIYVVHDEPLPYPERLYINTDYVNLINKCLQHKDKTIKRVAALIKPEFTSIDTTKPTTVLELLHDRFKQEKELIPSEKQTEEKTDISKLSYADIEEIYFKKLISSNMELGKNRQSSNMELKRKFKKLLSSNMELSENSGKKLSSDMELSKNKPSSILELSVPIRVGDDLNNTTYTYSNTYINTSTELNWYDLNLTKQDKVELVNFMQNKQLSLSLAQSVLDEMQAKIQNPTNNKPINNIKGYLFGMVKKASKGEFNKYLAKDKTITEHGTAKDNDLAFNQSAKPKTTNSNTLQRGMDAKQTIEALQKIKQYKQKLKK